MWIETPFSCLQHLADSMPHCVAPVIQAKGGATQDVVAVYNLGASPVTKKTFDRVHANPGDEKKIRGNYIYVEGYVIVEQQTDN